MAVLRFVRHWCWLEEEIVERSTHLITAFEFRHTVHTHTRTYTHEIRSQIIFSQVHKSVQTHTCVRPVEKMFAASTWKLNTDSLYSPFRCYQLK